MKSPCMDCQDRVMGCHGSCAKYIEWRKKRNAHKRECRNGLIIDNMIDRYKVDACFRAKYRRKVYS